MYLISAPFKYILIGKRRLGAQEEKAEAPGSVI